MSSNDCLLRIRYKEDVIDLTIFCFSAQFLLQIEVFPSLVTQGEPLQIEREGVHLFSGGYSTLVLLQDEIRI